MQRIRFNIILFIVIQKRVLYNDLTMKKKEDEEEKKKKHLKVNFDAQTIF